MLYNQLINVNLLTLIDKCPGPNLNCIAGKLIFKLIFFFKLNKWINFPVKDLAHDPEN